MEQTSSPRPSVRATDDRSFLEAEATLEKAGRVEDLIRLYESRGRDVPAPEAARLLGRAADLALERLRNPARAEELLRRALLLAPEPLPVLRAMKALYEAKQDAAALADTLERLASATTGKESAALLPEGGGPLRDRSCSGGTGRCSACSSPRAPRRTGRPTGGCASCC